MTTDFQKIFDTPSSGPYYPGKIENLFFRGVNFYLGKMFKINSPNIQNMEMGENVWIVKLRDPKRYRNFILVSNKKYVNWVSIRQIITY
ncbi:hypothetical protein K9M42_03300 [Patescibacteria group bacterium]|nr:hypothetical protein [Patescibacteria group bacterium]